MNDTVSPPCEDAPTPGPRSVVPALVLDHTLHITTLAQRALMAAEWLKVDRTGHSLLAAQVTMLGCWYDLLGLRGNTPDERAEAIAVAQAVVRHGEEVTGAVIPF